MPKPQQVSQVEAEVAQKVAEIACEVAEKSTAPSYITYITFNGDTLFIKILISFFYFRKQ